MAVSTWGEARATLDADWLVWVEPESQESKIATLGERLALLPKDPFAFVRQTRVLPLRTTQGVRCDIVFGVLPWEKAAIGRAPLKQFAGKQVPVASLEDLILMKLISEREKDIDDGTRLLKRFAGRLDRTSLEPQLRELAEALGRDDILRLLKESFGG